MDDEFENALAWFRSAPEAWIESAKKNLTACAEWIWEVLQGDFNQKATTAQVATGTIISMIPFVDQICDIRDFIANAKNINENPSNKWYIVSLILTLIGLFPTLGSLVKGCGKVMFSSLRKAGNVSGVVPNISRHLDIAVSKLGKFLARPEVVRTMASLKIDNPYKYLATHIRKLSDGLNVQALRGAMNDVTTAARRMLALIEKWGNNALATKAKDLLAMLEKVRRKADDLLPAGLRDAKKVLDQLARRLDRESDMAHRAHLNAINPHAFSRHTEASEIAVISSARPAWVETSGELTYASRLRPASKKGWRSTKIVKGVTNKIGDAHRTFHSMSAITIAPGTKLYRVVDPKSADNSICWMSEGEFMKLQSKDEWRRRFAVWANWNRNGEYVTYVVPAGPGLKVWEGVTASQQMKGTSFVLQGGARQIVIHPDDIQLTAIGRREKTGWGFDDFNETTEMIGVPQQKNNWFS